MVLPSGGIFLFRQRLFLWQGFGALGVQIVVVNDNPWYSTRQMVSFTVRQMVSFSATNGVVLRD
jgi:hypothetical protein